MVDLGLESDRAVSATLPGRTSQSDRIVSDTTSFHVGSNDIIRYYRISGNMSYRIVSDGFWGVGGLEGGYVKLAVAPMVDLGARIVHRAVGATSSERMNPYMPVTQVS